MYTVIYISNMCILLVVAGLQNPTMCDSHFCSPAPIQKAHLFLKLGKLYIICSALSIYILENNFFKYSKLPISFFFCKTTSGEWSASRILRNVTCLYKPQGTRYFLCMKTLRTQLRTKRELATCSGTRMLCGTQN